MKKLLLLALCAFTIHLQGTEEKITIDLNGDKIPKTLKAPKWTIVNGALRSPENNILCQINNMPKNYYINLKIRRIKVLSKDQHLGFFIRKQGKDYVRLYCREDIFYILFPKYKVYQRLGKKLQTPFVTSDQSPWVDIKIMVDNADITLSVNGEIIGTYDKVSISNGSFAIANHNNQIEVKDIVITPIK